MTRVGVIVAMFLFFSQSIARDIKGAINLDQYTLDKVVATHTVFVRFDRQHAYGEKEEIFKDLALYLGGKATPDDFILAYVGVQEYQERLSLEMAEKRYGITKSDWPTYRLFLKGMPDDPIVYTGPITVDAMTQFLKDEGGIELGKLGSLYEMDKKTREFVAAKVDQRPSILAAASDEMSRMHDATSAKWYVKTMEHIIESDSSYIEKEMARLERLKEAPRVAEDKIKEFKTRLSILSKFTLIHDEL